MAVPRKNVIVDLDAGTDDYLALLILLKNPEIQIQAIVCTNGNTSVENVCKNVVRLLEIVKRTDIPVYKGVSQQLIPIDFNFKYYHGKDGFGDLEHQNEPNLEIIREEPAPFAINEIIKKFPNDISLICIGPLTNLALTIRLFNNSINLIKDLWIMGGNHTACGNITAAAEFNFYFDPEAVYIVLESIKKPIYLLTWETCLYAKISMEWRFKVFGNKTSPEIQLLNKAEERIYVENPFDPNWVSCDAFLAAAFTNPSIITKKTSYHASIELHGTKTRGQTVLDHLKIHPENVVIFEEIDVDLFKTILLKL